MKRDSRLFRFIILLIQYADDRDVGQFLLNFLPKIIEDNRKHQGMSYKEILLHSLLCPSLRQYQKIILHLKALTCNFYSFNFYSLYNRKKNLARLGVYEKSFLPIDTPDKLGKIINNYEGSIEDVNNINRIDKKSLEKCLSILINNYTKHGFYYEIYGDTITKITITNTVKEECYKLLNMPTATYILNMQTMLKINLHQHIKDTYCFELDRENEPQNIKYFISINEKIINALTSINKPCKLCLPIENQIKMRALCPHCKNLLIALKQLKQLTESRIYKACNFEKDISAIKLKDNDYVQLRQARRKYIYKLLRIAKKDILQENKTTVEDLIKTIKIQADYIFQT